jgi:hypothetical protein
MQSYVFTLLQMIQLSSSDSFTGVGLVFYRSLHDLPAFPLGDDSLFEPKLPILGIEKIAQVLASISRLDSPWHDGFHLINADSHSLTHVSQFVTPPASLLPPILKGQMPLGARQMAANAVSRLASVSCAALLNADKKMSVFQDGELLAEQ